MSDISSSLVAGLLAPGAFALLDLPIIDLLAFAVVVGKTLLDNFKIELFNGKKNFNSWQKKVFDVLDVHNLADYL
ncbi:hypothetical protein WN944_018853 [Citrus x changshan-huyou]|uniref:Uncharacterized protein n=1 Tax=Citrus x changshan-huyou TaxID=2935761 RepID=A0AAP0QF87_9ROSI